MKEHRTTLLTKNERKFVTAVQSRISNADTRHADDPELLDKLIQAYREARCMGLTREALVADFLYLEMQSPGFHRQPAIRRWLCHRGASPDERFGDLIDLLTKKSSQLDGGK